MAIQFNYLMDKGAFAQQADGTFALDLTKFRRAVRDLDHHLLTLEAQGDHASAKKLLDDMGVLRPALKKAFDRLDGIPTDIEPIFVTADELAPEKPQSASKAGEEEKIRSNVGASVPLVAGQPETNCAFWNCSSAPAPGRSRHCGLGASA